MSFASEIGEITRGYEALLLDIARKAQLDMLRDVVLMTPVDTGRARSGWQASQGSPAIGEPGGVDPSGGITIAAGTEVILASRPGDWWLANSVPYIVRLEYGWSQQAPNGMAGIAAGRFEQNVAAAVAALGRR